MRTKYHLDHDPKGWAVNMGWVVRDSIGQEVYRGPEWMARIVLRNRNGG